MGFKVRGYTREVTQEKVRDYSLFAIACEGTVTEPGYFRPFDGIDRIKVDIIEQTDEDGQEKKEGSSPRKVLEIEIWLLYHKMADLTGLGIATAQEAKRALGKIDGGYYYIKYLPLMLDAIENASHADSVPEGWMPKLLETKVYQLGRALYERIGKVRFEKFVASLPELDRKVRGKAGKRK